MNVIKKAFLLSSFLLLTFVGFSQSKSAKADKKSGSTFDIVFDGSFAHQFAIKMEWKVVEGEITGQYYMAGMPVDRPINGTLKKNGSFSLREFSSKGTQIGAFAGKIYDDNFVSGVYKSFTEGSDLVFTLLKSDGKYGDWKASMDNSVATEILYGRARTVLGQEVEFDTAKISTIEWKSMSHDFGEITEGEKVKFVYTFTNTGPYPVKIRTVKPSCGCTSPDWTRKEIGPGEIGSVEVEFDSRGKSGQQRKSVSVNTNTIPAVVTLKFSALVKRP